MQSSTSTLLEADGLTRWFGGLRALSGYSLRLAAGEVLGLIGPNGAGKTTAFNLLTGVLKPTEGRIRAGATDLTGTRPERFAAAGIARTFQNIRLFRDISVWENVAVGLHMRAGPGWLATVLSLPGALRQERRLRERAAALLERLGLGDHVDRRAADLPYGLQRKVEIARALATDPAVLLLDEPAAGMNTTETAALMDTLAGLADESSLTLVVVDHDMRLVMGLCRRVQVLNRGELIADGAPGDVQRNADVITAYLGTGRRRAHA